MVVELMLHRNRQKLKKLKVISGHLLDFEKILLVFEFLAWNFRNFASIELVSVKVETFLFRLMCHL